ncbi:transposase, partial [Bacteroides sp. 3_1_23]|uniref:transposase n=1 Tax=Bacteroides sp. 3_1_23 TaxID=457390 RepID=UPI001E647E2F
MEELKKKYTPYTESERMSYIREYLSTSETKYQFAKRTGICRRLLILWLDKYHINDKVMSTEQPSLSKRPLMSLSMNWRKNSLHCVPKTASFSVP